MGLPNSISRKSLQYAFGKVSQNAKSWFFTQFLQNFYPFLKFQKTYFFKVSRKRLSKVKNWTPHFLEQQKSKQFHIFKEKQVWNCIPTF